MYGLRDEDWVPKYSEKDLIGSVSVYGVEREVTSGLNDGNDVDKFYKRTIRDRWMDSNKKNYCKNSSL